MSENFESYMPEKVKSFISMIRSSGQEECAWRQEGTGCGWSVFIITSEIEFYFDINGNFQYCMNFR